MNCNNHIAITFVYARQEWHHALVQRDYARAIELSLLWWACYINLNWIQRTSDHFINQEIADA